MGLQNTQEPSQGPDLVLEERNGHASTAAVLDYIYNSQKCTETLSSM